METLGPLQFRPILKRYLWGGRQLGERLGKAIGEGTDYAESWEIVDHGADQSVVTVGKLAGKSLHGIIQQHADALLGSHAATICNGQFSADRRFPLLFKFLDAQRDLSVQVHPNDFQGSQLDPPDLGKTEAWVILAAKPGSQVYAGLRPEIDRQTLIQHIERGTTESCLHRFEPQVGDCIFIPAGTVHALGAGLLVAEIQQSSNTTFRLFDWNRVDEQGRGRTLHIDQALSVIDFERGPIQAQIPQSTDQPARTRLAQCEYFILDRWKLANANLIYPADRRFHILTVLEGQISVSWERFTWRLSVGHTLLLPATSNGVQLQVSEQTTLLDMYLPEAVTE